MSFPIFNTTETLLCLILLVVAVSIWAQKFKVMKKVGPALTVIVAGIALSNLQIVPSMHESYAVIFVYAVPLAISLYLLNMDLTAIRKMGSKPLIAMAVAIGSVTLMALVFGLVFAGQIFEGWKIAGMFVGTYTGGSSNLTAIAVGLSASQDTIAAANAADYVVGIPTMILMFAAPALLARSKWFQKKWPYRFTEEEYTVSSGEKFFAEETWSIKDIAILLAMAFTIVAVCGYLSGFFPSDFAAPAKILLISTISVVLAQVPAVKKLKGKLNLGLYLSMAFLLIVGFMVDLRGFFGSAVLITVFCLCVIVASLIVHLALMRLLKIKYEYAVLSITASIADGPTAALVAASGRWENLVGVGLLLGVIGAVCGNYVGIGLAYALKALLGA